MTNPATYPVMDHASVQLPPDATIMDALSRLEDSLAKIVLVTDSAGVLLGSVVDGDIRRGLLRGCTLQSPVKEVMRTSPTTLPEGTPRARILEIMRTFDIKQVPLVNAQGKLIGIAVHDALAGLRHAARPNPVVIMAGGKGKRLLPITTDMPKPMVPVGGKPILEWIILRLTHYGFRDFHLAVNYLGQQIEDYFGSGSGFDCHIRYLREKEFLGTAGALSLLESPPAHPMLVMNGDILSSIDFDALLAHHAASGAAATLCARNHQVEVPFGVIQQEGGFLKGLAEKPVYENLISAGMYVINPEVLATIPKNTPTDMPSVLLSLVQSGKPVSVFSMQEDWVDVGRHDDLDRAKRAFASNG